jgi:hypothetical protein
VGEGVLLRCGAAAALVFTEADGGGVETDLLMARAAAASPLEAD